MGQHQLGDLHLHTVCRSPQVCGRVADDSKVVKLPYYATANVQIIEIGNLLCS